MTGEFKLRPEQGEISERIIKVLNLEGDIARLIRFKNLPNPDIYDRQVIDVLSDSLRKNTTNEIEDVSAWGAFVQGRLAAFLISVTAEGNWQEWIVNHSLTELRNKYANNALSFTVARHFLTDQKSEGVCYGLGSLEETGQLDHFKKRMGWTVMPVKQRLVFSSKLALVSKLAKGPALKLMNKLFPKNYTVRKASAMFRLYNQQSTSVPQPQDES